MSQMLVRKSAYSISVNGMRFVIIRAVRYNGNIKNVAQKWINEQKVVGQHYFFNTTKSDIIITGEKMQYKIH